MSNLHFKTPAGQCECGKTLDHATPTDHDCSPEPGALTVCVGCARILRFDEDLRPRSMTPDQFAELPANVQREARKVARLITNFHARKQRLS